MLLVQTIKLMICFISPLSSSKIQNLSGAGLQGIRTYPPVFPLPFPLPRYKVYQGQVCKVAEHILVCFHYPFLFQVPLPFPLPRYKVYQGQVFKVAEYIWLCFHFSFFFQNTQFIWGRSKLRAVTEYWVLFTELYFVTYRICYAV